MKFQVITLFPELIHSQLQGGVVGQAVSSGLVQVETINPRIFTKDVHKTVDDRPYGGGDGMVLLYLPLQASLASVADLGHVVYLSAHGVKWHDSLARQYANRKEPITLICGRYGGIDQRIINEYVDEQISIGDYILSGGELAASVLIDTTVRFLPEVLGNEDSNENDSFAKGLLEAPLFTRPQLVGEQRVPQLLLSGDHAKIAQAQHLLALLLTFKSRPDLILQSHRVQLLTFKKLLNEFSTEDWRSCGLETNEVERYFYEAANNP